MEIPFAPMVFPSEMSLHSGGIELLVAKLLISQINNDHKNVKYV